MLITNRSTWTTMTARPTYIHQLDEWPTFRWNEEAVTEPLVQANNRLAELIGNANILSPKARSELTIRHLTVSAVASSNIENVFPDPNAVRQAIIRYISGQSQPSGRNSIGIAAITADSAINHTAPLTEERLHQWHRWLFPIPTLGVSVGRFRRRPVRAHASGFCGPRGTHPRRPF